MKLRFLFFLWISSAPIILLGQNSDRPMLSQSPSHYDYHIALSQWFCKTPQFNLDSAYVSLATLENLLLKQSPVDYHKLADLNTKWANLYKDFQFFNKAKLKSQKALEFYSKVPIDAKDPKLEADIYWLLSLTFHHNNDQKKAFYYFTKQDSILRNFKDEISQVKRNQNKANFNYSFINGDKELAYKLIEANIPLQTKLGDYTQLFRNYMLLARRYKDLDFSKYEMLRDSANLYADRAKNPYFQTFYPLELTYALIVNGQYNEATIGIKKVLDAMKQYGLDKSNYYQSAMQDLGEIEWKQKRYDLAINYYKECLAIAENLEVKIMQLSLLEIISYIYVDKKDFKNAFYFMDQYKDLYKENEKELADRSAAEHELELDLANEKINLEKNKTYSKMLTIGLVFFVLGFGFIVYSYRKQNRMNQLLEKNIQQKDDLLKEIHHRVKNNLSVISGLLELQSYNLKNDAFELTFKESQNRVKSIALIHQRLYQHETVSSIELKDYINDLYKQIYNVFNINKEVVFTNLVEKTMLDIDTAVPLGLILNELFTNSFKYAFTDLSKGEIIIELKNLEEGSYQLFYKDNGQGLKEDFDFKKVTSFGLKLVSRLCLQLFGKVKFEKSNGLSIFTIDFKDKVGKIKAEQ